MADVKAVKIDEMEGAFGGAFKRPRAELGVTSFGIPRILSSLNVVAVAFPPNCDS